jgi:hypothetical protein
MIADRALKRWKRFRVRQIKRRNRPQKPPSYKSEQFSDTPQEMSSYTIDDESNQ